MEFLEICIQGKNIPVLCLPGRPRVLLDQTVAGLYGTTTNHVKKAVNRNRDKFPPDFCFQLTEQEFALIKDDNRFNLKYSYQLPYAFTHLGANMLANILRSEIAVQRSLQIVRVFTALEKGELGRLLCISKKIFIHGIPSGKV